MTAVSFSLRHTPPRRSQELACERAICKPGPVQDNVFTRTAQKASAGSGACGCSAVGSASPCQGEGREFESRHPLQHSFTLYTCVRRHTPWWNGRVVRQRSAKPCTRVRFPFPPPVSVATGGACAISSAGERFPDTEEVTGSIPVSRTRGFPTSLGCPETGPGFKFADVAQLVAHHLAKVRVASSSLVIRSTFSRRPRWGGVLYVGARVGDNRGTSYDSEICAIVGNCFQQWGD